MCLYVRVLRDLYDVRVVRYVYACAGGEGCVCVCGS